MLAIGLLTKGCCFVHLYLLFLLLFHCLPRPSSLRILAQYYASAHWYRICARSNACVLSLPQSSIPNLIKNHSLCLCWRECHILDYDHRQRWRAIRIEYVLKRAINEVLGRKTEIVGGAASDNLFPAKGAARLALKGVKSWYEVQRYTTSIDDANIDHNELWGCFSLVMR
jgi:hypothetical protein